MNESTYSLKILNWSHGKRGLGRRVYDDQFRNKIQPMENDGLESGILIMGVVFTVHGRPHHSEVEKAASVTCYGNPKQLQFNGHSVDLFVVYYLIPEGSSSHGQCSQDVSYPM